MGYLQLPSVSDTKQAVFSLWFRVPADTLAAVTDEFNAWLNDGGTRSPLTGIVPLLTFGPTTKQKKFEFRQVAIGSFPQSANWHWSDGFGFPGCIGAKWVMGTGTLQPSQPVTAGQYFDTGGTVDLDPSYIGVDCTGPYPALSVHIAMPSSNASTVKGSWGQQTGYLNTASGIPNYSGSGACPGAPNYYIGPFGLQMMTVTNPPGGFSSVWTNTNNFSGSDFNLLMARPEFFRLLPSARVGDSGGQLFGYDNADQGYGGQEVTPDAWHHLLLSFDFTDACITSGGRSIEVRHTDPHTGITVTDSPGADPVTRETSGTRTSSACKMWVAFDDVNLIENKLSCYWPTGKGSNAILSVTGFFTACDNVYDVTDRTYDISGTDVTNTSVHPTPAYSFTPSDIPFSGGPFGLPAISDYIDAIKRVEMAELQIFFDTTLDTGLIENRRAFIVEKKTTDADGTVSVVLKPETPSKAEELLGKRPDILLHRASNWKKGKNTGSIGVDDEGREIDSGQFAPTGEIKKYTPDPSIRE